MIINIIDKLPNFSSSFSERGEVATKNTKNTKVIRDWGQ